MSANSLRLQYNAEEDAYLPPRRARTQQEKSPDSGHLWISTNLTFLIINIYLPRGATARANSLIQFAWARILLWHIQQTLLCYSTFSVHFHFLLAFFPPARISKQRGTGPWWRSPASSKRHYSSRGVHIWTVLLCPNQVKQTKLRINCRSTYI